MALYQDGILISGANTLPRMTLAEYNALLADKRPTYWERIDADYDDILAEKTDIAPVESTSTASQPHAKGSQFYFNNQLVTATADISVGGTIVLNGNCTLADSITKYINDVISDVSRLKGDIQIPATITTENAFCREIGRAVSTIPDNSSVAKSVLWSDHNIYSLFATRRAVFITVLLFCQSNVLSYTYTTTSDTVSGIKITGTAI